MDNTPTDPNIQQIPKDPTQLPTQPIPEDLSHLDPEIRKKMEVSPIKILPDKKLSIFILALFVFTFIAGISLRHFLYYVPMQEEETKNAVLPTPTVAPNYQGICEDSGGSWVSQYSECESMSETEGIDKGTCTSLGGNYNGCNSACRHSEESDVACIQICVQTCTFN